MKLNPFAYRTFRMVFYVALMIPFLFSIFPWTWMAAENGNEDSSGQGLVYVVEVQDEIERGLGAYMERSFAEAEEAFADHIILDIDTPGGLVDAAGEIGQLIRTSDIPVTAYVNPHATSAGAYISLNADNIVMEPAASIGAAAVVDMEGNVADEKATSTWISRMEGAAELNNRDPIYARAMVDPDVEIEGVVEEGEILDFSTSEAMEHGYAEAVAEDIGEVLAFLEMEGAQVERTEIAMAEHLARFITNPFIASILMSLGGIGLILELYNPGFGVPGTIGIASILLFFFGHLIAGFAGWESVLLFIAGAVLLVIEFMVAGFGIFGILGLAAIGGSLAMASETTVTGLINLGIALLLTMVVALVLAKFLDKKGVWSKLVLSEALETEETISTYQKKSELIGLQGTTLTQLRPSGTILIDGKQYDVVSDGYFIGKDEKVEIIEVDGPRLVVKEVEDEST